MFEFIQSLKAVESGCPVQDDYMVVFNENREIILAAQTQMPRIPFPLWQAINDFLPENREMFCIGNLDGRNCFAVEVSGVPLLSSKLQAVPIRQFLFEYPEDCQLAVCRAKGLLSWRRQHRFCGGCRGELIASEHDSGLICPKCKNVYFPQLAPAVIVAITRKNGKELLLAHNRNFSGNMYSLIAGFVEAGESVEAALHREVWEECSLRIKNLQYITSQLWPFPNSLMLAFEAEYDSGDARADGKELSSLGWFTAENHPELPNNGSVARQVIDRIFSR